jgi:hypothetical protein
MRFTQIVSLGAGEVAGLDGEGRIWLLLWGPSQPDPEGRIVATRIWKPVPLPEPADA